MSSGMSRSVDNQDGFIAFLNLWDEVKQKTDDRTEITISKHHIDDKVGVEFESSTGIKSAVIVDEKNNAYIHYSIDSGYAGSEGSVTRTEYESLTDAFNAIRDDFHIDTTDKYTQSGPIRLSPNQ